MARRTLVVWLAVLGLAVSSPTRAAEPALQSGDLVFETSASSQSAAIRWATGSRWSHVGIVDVTEDGVAVIEAIGKVSRTPWAAWAPARPSRRGPARREAPRADRRAA
jgi:hypothetical protein